VLFCQYSRNNNRVTLLPYDWAKFMCKSLKSRKTSTISIFRPHSTASDIRSFSMRQRKRRTSKTTLKHKTISQLDICYTLFPNAEYFHTFPYSLVARKYVFHCTLRYFRLPKCFHIKFTSKTHTSQDFRLTQ
jgi:hypothetical protein